MACAHDLGDLGVLGLGPVEHRRACAPSTPSASKYAAARSPTRSGCSNAAAVGSTTTSLAPRRREQLGVEVTAAARATRRRRPARSVPARAGSAWLMRPAEPTVTGIRPAVVHRRERRSYRTSNLLAFPSAGVRGEQDERSSSVGIVGSGLMGSGVAEVAAKAGFEVVAAQPHRRRGRRDDARAREVAQRARSRRASSTRGVRGRSARARARGHRPRRARRRATSCCESIVEDLAAKQELFSRARPDLRAGDDPRDATRRRSRSSRWRWQTGRPERVCGIHFFNPRP